MAIKFYSTETPGNIPGSLEPRSLAFNISDRKIFIGNIAGDAVIDMTETLAQGVEYNDTLHNTGLTNLQDTTDDIYTNTTIVPQDCGLEDPTFLAYDLGSSAGCNVVLSNTRSFAASYSAMYLKDENGITQQTIGVAGCYVDGNMYYDDIAKILCFRNGDSSQQVRVYDFDGDILIHKLDFDVPFVYGSGSNYSSVVHLNGEFFVTNSSNGTMYVYNAAGTEIRTLSVGSSRGLVVNHGRVMNFTGATTIQILDINATVVEHTVYNSQSMVTTRGRCTQAPSSSIDGKSFAFRTGNASYWEGKITENLLAFESATSLTFINQNIPYASDQNHGHLSYCPNTGLASHVGRVGTGGDHTGTLFFIDATAVKYSYRNDKIRSSVTNLASHNSYTFGNNIEDLSHGALGDYSVTFGEGTNTTQDGGMAIGYFNSSFNSLLAVGRGTSNVARSDAFIVGIDGDVQAPNATHATGDSLTTVDYVANLTTGSLFSDGSIDMDGGYVPVNDQSIATKIFVEATHLTVVEETSVSSYTPDFSANYFEYTLTENAVLLDPINTTKGQTGEIIVKMDATGGWNLNWDINYELPIGLPELNTDPYAVNVFSYRVIDLDSILIEFVAAYTEVQMLAVNAGLDSLAVNDFDVLAV